MKINLSKQSIYILILSFVLFIFIIIFSFSVLVPEGKEYRIKRTLLKKQNFELRQLENLSLNIKMKLEKLTSDNKHIVEAFNKKFDEARFKKQYQTYFKSLELSQKVKQAKQEGFHIYDVNTTSSINSPKNFYNFLDAINKSDWIIKINFPINFKRDKELIKSSFTIKVYTR